MIIDKSTELKIIYILLNLGLGVIVAWLSVLFIGKVYLKIRPKEKKLGTNSKKDELIIWIITAVGLLVIIGIQVLMFWEGKGKITLSELLTLNLLGIALTVSTVLLLSSHRVQKWLRIR